MAGASIKVTVRDAEIVAAFDRLREKDGGLVPAALKNIGQQIVKSTRRRFDQQKAPDGQPWKPLNPEYAKGKRGTKILQEQGMRGGLLGSITYRVGPDSVTIGTNKVYAAAHQFGATILPRTADRLVFRLGGRVVFARKVTIPARPFLGISAEDRAAILQVVGDHIEGTWEG
jgi:phage virion morphogenesis protein